MKRSLWRSMLTCLLLASLTFSGFASAGMLGCATMRAPALAADVGAARVATTGAAAVSGTDAAPVQARAHMPHEHMPHGHMSHGQMSLGHPSNALAPTAIADHGGDLAGIAADALAATHDSPVDASHQCSSCAPCSLGMAPVGDLPLRLPALAPSAEFPAADARYRSAWLGNLDRPPRLSLA